MRNKYTDAQIRILEKEKIVCEDVVALLDDYVAQDLSSTLDLRLHEHVNTCEFCAEVDAGYRLTVELASELADKPIPVGVQNRLREGLNRRLGLNLTLVA